MNIFPYTNTDDAEVANLADKGDADAQYERGLRLIRGDDVSNEDCEQGYKLFRKAADQGHPRALWRIGTCFERENDLEAVHWYQKSAAKGYAVAQWWLGIKYLRGEGVNYDGQKALKWILKAAEQGEISACYKLGCMYEEGTVVSQDYMQSICWLKKAAEHGDAVAYRQLGSMFEESRNYQQAVYWYKKAAEQYMYPFTKPMPRLGWYYND